MEKFNKYNINISDKDKIIIKDYLNKVKSFVEKHNLEKELFNDIEEWVFEKLEEIHDVKNKDVMKIINEMWEPEDIFDLDEKDIKASSKDILINESKEILGKTTKTAKNVGVSLWEMFGDKLNKIGELIFKIVHKILDMIIYILEKTLVFIKWILENSFAFIKWILQKFSAIIGAFLCFIGFSIVAWSALLMFREMSISNIEYFGFVPEILKIAGIIWWMAWVILGVGFMIRKVITTIILVPFIWGVAVSLMLCVFTAFELTSNYAYNNEKVEEFKIELPEDKTVTLDDIEMNDSWFDHLFFIRDSYFIRTYSTKEDSVILKMKTEVYGKNKEDIANKMEILTDLKLKNNNGLYKLVTENENTFTKKATYFPFARELSIYIPEGAKVDVSNTKSWRFYFQACTKWDEPYYNYFDKRVIENVDGEICFQKRSE